MLDAISAPSFNAAILVDITFSGAAPGWQSNYAYAAGSWITDTSGHRQISSGGVSGASTPAWNDSGGTTSDGTITWQDGGVSTGAPYTVYLWTGQGNLTWNGNVYVGLGGFLGVGQQIADTATVEARGITLSFSGLDPALTPAAMSEVVPGLPVTVFLAAMNAGVPVVSPIILWSGCADEPTVKIGAESASITLACENLLVSMDVPVDRRLTPQDQQSIYPGDLGLQFVYQFQDQNIWFGVKTEGQNV
jgi:hypothetical protein